MSRPTMQKYRYIRNNKLRRARELRGWTQREVADHIYLADARTLRRWENGEAFPSLRFRAKLCEVFLQSPEELGLILEPQVEKMTLPESHTVQVDAEGECTSLDDEQTGTPNKAFWNLPHRRNPSFTGRIDLLNQIQMIFEQQQNACLPCLVALCGLGGLGKTQVAVEYAYRNLERYGSVVWLNASSFETMMLDLLFVTQFLHLPGQDQISKSLPPLIDVIKTWLEPQKTWLLILDNVTDIGKIEALFPPLLNGHVLLTTRAQVTGMLAHRLNVLPMNTQEGTLFLLRRTKLLQRNQPLDDVEKSVLAVATDITRAMSGHPLALDQVGAYIEETQCNLADCLALYRADPASLLKRRGLFRAGHSDSILTTLRFCIESASLSNSLTAEFLFFCAFLHPSSIPEELFTTNLCPPLQPLAANSLLFNEILGILMSYSLINRNPLTRTFSIHPLVQESLKIMLSQEQQKAWAMWVLQVIARVFPDNTLERSLYQRYLPHAYVCATLIERYQLQSPAAGRFLHMDFPLLTMAMAQDLSQVL
jgi:transcriptional regulator with XRE-family HTH domain